MRKSLATLVVSAMSAIFLPSCAEPVDGSSCSVQELEDGVFLVCKDGTKGRVFNGQDGVDGEDGVDGVNGQDGEDGRDGISARITDSIFCTGNIEGTDLYADYTVVLMESGDIWSNANIRDQYDSTSGSSYYSSQQVGASTAPVFVSRDVYYDSNYGYWEISLDRETLITYIEYFDVHESSDVYLFWYMTPDKCVVNSYTH